VKLQTVKGPSEPGSQARAQLIPGNTCDCGGNCFFARRRWCGCLSRFHSWSLDSGESQAPLASENFGALGLPVEIARSAKGLFSRDGCLTLSNRNLWNIASWAERDGKRPQSALGPGPLATNGARWMTRNH